MKVKSLTACVIFLNNFISFLLVNSQFQHYISEFFLIERDQSGMSSSVNSGNLMGHV
jgi:hypothetical protein